MPHKFLKDPYLYPNFLRFLTPRRASLMKIDNAKMKLNIVMIYLVWKTPYGYVLQKTNKIKSQLTNIHINAKPKKTKKTILLVSDNFSLNLSSETKID